MAKETFFWGSIATIVGTIIGAGILGIPHVIARAGFWTGVVDIFILGACIMMLYLYLGEVTLRTKGFHQMTGYAQKYLGKHGKFLMMASMIFGIYGPMVAYILGIGASLETLLGMSAMFWAILFFALSSFIAYLGLKRVFESELLMLPMILIIVAIISIASIKHINSANYTAFSLPHIFIPYGFILTAFLGSTAIPAARMALVGKEKLLKRAVMIGLAIPLSLYLIFTIFVIGVTGTGTTDIATIGLGNVIGGYIFVMGNVFAVITMATSFLGLGLALQQIYHYDYNLDRLTSWALTFLIPLAIVMWNITTFTQAFEVTGSIAGGLTSALIILMVMKAKKEGDRKPEYSIPINKFIASLFFILFIAGLIFYFWEPVKVFAFFGLNFL